jgi:S1-C subfamily serine protease
LQVSRVVSKGPCDGLATEGDLVATVSGEVVTTTQDLEAKLWEATEATLGASASEQMEHRGPVEVQLTLLRRGKEHTVKAAVQLLGCDGARRVVCWHGLLLEETPRCVREFGPVPAGVHIAQTMLGSPGEANAIDGDFVLSVDGNPTPTLDAVLALDDACQQSSQGAGAARRLRVETADMVGRRFVKTLEPNPLFWPTCVMLQGARGGWSCAEHRAGPAAAGAQGSRE